MNVKIKAIELFDNARKMKPESRDRAMGLAKFTAQLDHMTIKGCSLVRFPNGTLTTYGPSTSIRGEGTYFENDLKHAVTMAAKEAFLNMGGDPDELDFPDDDLIPRKDSAEEWIEGLRDRG
ncbi:MAG: hypothetical protein ABGW84_08100 [Sphingomonadaceae bacterium]